MEDDSSRLPSGANVDPRGANVDPRGANVDPRGANVDPRGANVDPRGANVDPRGANVDPRGANVDPRGANVDPRGANVCHKCEKYFKRKIDCDRHVKKCKGNDNLQCPICMKIFETRYGKYKHMKNVKCLHPDDDVGEDVLEDECMTISVVEAENKQLRTEIELLKSNKPIIINNTTNNTVQINSYDNPSIEHMTSGVVRKMYYKSKQDAHMMILEAIRTIFKNDNIPQNDSIRLIDGSKSKFAQVQMGDEKIILPLIEVLETILTKSGEVCGDGLRECEEDGTIRGIRCSVVKSLMDTLATDDREGDRGNRAKFLPYVKSALL